MNDPKSQFSKNVFFTGHLYLFNTWLKKSNHIQNNTFDYLNPFRKLFLVVLLMAILCFSPRDRRILFSEAPKHEPTWESLTTYQTPDWFLDAKFGIYFLWGPYSVPAYKTEWCSHYMYDWNHSIHKYHLKTYGTLDKFGYKDFIPLFTAESFDAEEWVTLFQNAGHFYAIVLGWPRNRLRINSLAKKTGNLDKEIKQIELMGFSEKLSWNHGDDYLPIDLPANKPGNHAFAFKISFE
jgi:hypothetical protein